MIVLDIESTGRQLARKVQKLPPMVMFPGFRKKTVVVQVQLPLESPRSHRLDRREVKVPSLKTCTNFLIRAQSRILQAPSLQPLWTFCKSIAGESRSFHGFQGKMKSWRPVVVPSPVWESFCDKNQQLRQAHRSGSSARLCRHRPLTKRSKRFDKKNLETSDQTVRFNRKIDKTMSPVAFSRTMKIFRIPLILAILAAGFLPINSAEAQRYTNIRVRPPLIIETPGHPPRRGMVWIPGHWRWSQRHLYWVWVRGHWARR